MYMYMYMYKCTVIYSKCTVHVSVCTVCVLQTGNLTKNIIYMVQIIELITIHVHEVVK